MCFLVFCQEGGSVCASNQKKKDDSVRMIHQNMGQHLQYMVSDQKNSPCILSMKLIWALLTFPCTVQCSFTLHYLANATCGPNMHLFWNNLTCWEGEPSCWNPWGKKITTSNLPMEIPIRQEADHQNDLVSRDPVLYPLRCPRPIGCQSNFAIQPSWNSHELPPSRVVIYPKKLRRNVDEWMAYLNIIYFSGKEVSLNTVSFTKWASGTGFCWMVFMNYKEER